jgi:hypothetical protein
LERGEREKEEGRRGRGLGAAWGLPWGGGACCSSFSAASLAAVCDVREGEEEKEEREKKRKGRKRKEKKRKNMKFFSNLKISEN